MNFELTADQHNIRAQARRFAREEVAPVAREADAAGALPPHLIPRMGALGLLGGPIDPRYGGAGMDAVSFTLVAEELGRVDSSLRGCFTVQIGLVAMAIQLWGTDSQKAASLPKLARGEVLGCYCLTEPGAGSDAAALQTTAREDGDGYVLDGEKIWITNGMRADVAVLFATRDPAARHRGLCAFLVDCRTPGFRRETMPGRPLGHRAADHARIVLSGCRVPGHALLGSPGEGFKVAMSALDHGRLGVAAGAVGVAQACLDACVEFSRRRRQFGRRIADFQMIAAALADMAADVEAARLLVYRAAWTKDRGLPATTRISIAKLFATEAAARAASQAVLIHGGRGYSDESPVERYYRDIKGLQIYEGTSHIQRLIIARDLVGREEGPATPS